MKFYRRLLPFKAISFDLDDTLYSNKPVMQTAERAMTVFFAQILPQCSHTFDRRFWTPFRQQVIKNQPRCQHDVVELRLQTYIIGLISLQFTQAKAQQLAQQAVDFFLTERSKFSVPPASHDLLAQLAKKYPLVAISNGNVDTKAIGIAKYFTAIYHAGLQGDGGVFFNKKPSIDMFSSACQQLQLAPSQLLHVGDCGNADVQGALTAGCQAAWLSCYDVGKPLSVLPHLELTTITELSIFTL